MTGYIFYRYVPNTYYYNTQFIYIQYSYIIHILNNREGGVESVVY